jgi:hypothetical protein
MSETSNTSNDAVEEALMDHHLAEVAEMIDWAQAHKPTSKNPCSDSSPECPRTS